MPTLEYAFRLVVVDRSVVLLVPAKGEARVLPKREATHALHFLGLLGEPAALDLPKRSVELANKEPAPNGISYQYKLDRGMLKTLRDMAEYSDPVSTRELAQITSIPVGTASSRITKLFNRELISRSEANKAAYLVTQAGHKCLADYATSLGYKNE